MNKEYGREEINKILINKKIDEFFLAVIENRDECLTDEEYNKIKDSEKSIYGDNKDEVNNLINQINNNENLKTYSDEIMKMLFSFAQVRHVALLTMIDDNIYDIANSEFLNIKRNKIIHYDNFTNYYNENNSRLKLFTVEEEPKLKENSVLMDIDSEDRILLYEKNYVHQEKNDDLTNLFFREFNSEPLVFKKEKK